jgi:hypothetical protein
VRNKFFQAFNALLKINAIQKKTLRQAQGPDFDDLGNMVSIKQGFKD